MNSDVRFISAALRLAASEAKASGKQLRDVLDDKSNKQFVLAQSGQIASVSANGQTTVFAFGVDGGSPTSAEMLSIWTYLIELYDRAVASLEDSSNDDETVSLMQSYLRPVTGYTTNFCYLSK